MDKNFGGVIWTNHALDKLSERGIKQGDAWATFNRPEQSRAGSAKGSWIYYRTYPISSRLRGAGGNERIEVVATKNEKGEWVILSVWSRPVYGSRGERAKSEKREPIWKMMVRQILGR
ncbi:hypothetical protein A2V56_04555 [Candidatus Woesebacteria bacterium RBG_19FT_COMBO_42_9]|uniref:DUF4258 domain-containing protein n=1 Tax=Candidatus Woesebacteria bacterium RBG_16_42_24 TaxID=1802485 RepID=A0A1F7XLQ0_9BACT|nr:MAG: hypothetical protein A2V97_04535 [Candidatus Woesebacteria bacterium RBG_16_42_24]OGM16232.1 MAG: hypothetical protein A2V56_04555 [Candidatus Woesebacteria bacterium RBG_19FT_COMBO_42_9]OGM66320.1 MAG: hypothetical protein A2985_03915 [Candidatus Woesebacteria bacterium RIFCSPLOWO2_01_FULL_43_11]